VHLALTERDFTFDGEFFPVERPTTIATRPLQDPLPVWLGGASQATMRLAAARDWNIVRNFGSNAEHRDALEDYIKDAPRRIYRCCQMFSSSRSSSWWRATRSSHCSRSRRHRTAHMHTRATSTLPATTAANARSSTPAAN
jgi:alkanesulfonate monooxygenase SsuD/methylene tetrahydromethanopterin reductase-like flavin-dependent oxidoreductase (luciferase family)